MQFRDLKKQYEVLKEEIDGQIQGVLNSANFISGSQVKELESQLANYVRMKHCITCANGTDALTIALMVWNIGKGDVVFVPDFTFFSSGEVVSFVGATPVFVDVDEKTFNIDSEKLEEKIKEVLAKGELEPKAIVAVDLFGQPADYEKIREIASKYHLMILEDAAQGFGGKIGEKRACSFGDIATTSFFPAKPLGCYGDGGAIFTDNDEWAFLIRSYCVHGKGSTKYDNVRIGMNSRLDTLQAAILLVKLEAFERAELEAVNRIAERYTIGLQEYVKVPVVRPGYKCSWAQYTIQLESEEKRDGLQRHLKEREIPSMVYYMKPMHRQKAFENAYLENDYPVTERLSRTVLSIPMHPYLTEEMQEEIIMEIKNYLTTCQ